MQRVPGWRTAGLSVALATAAAGCGGGGPPPATSPRPPEVAALIATIEARDARIRTLYVEGTLAQGGGAATPCWWAQDGERFAHEGSGGKFRTRMVFADGESVRFAGTVVMERGPWVGGDYPLEATLPPEFGLGTGHARWARFLAWSPRVAVLGRETVGGRDCLKVACEQVPGTGATWTNPVVAWFDDQGTGLAMRYAILSRPGELARAGVTAAAEAAHTVDVDGDPRVTFMAYEILEVRDLAPGVAIGGRATRTMPALARDQPWLMAVTDARLNGPVDPACFAVPPRPPSPRMSLARAVGLGALAWVAASIGWTLWFRRRRRRDPGWPGADDPQVAAAQRTVRLLAWLAPPVAVGDLAQKACLAGPVIAGPLASAVGEGVLPAALFASTLAVGSGLLLAAAVRLDRALRGDPGRAAAAMGLAAVAGVLGGIPWVGLVGATCANALAFAGPRGPGIADRIEIVALALAQLPLFLVGLWAAWSWRRVARS